MKYTAIHFTFDTSVEYTADILASMLGDTGFESFVNTDKGLDAYIPSKLYDENVLKVTLENFPFPEQIDFEKEEMEDKNWNEEWEKYFFEPIIINDECIIHSSFHKDIPQLKYDIIIDPKMAFGTGHHETTSLMIGEILNMDLAGKSVLDMGCGTSVLAILAAMRGAGVLTAIDIDDWCVDNSLENIQLNNVSGIEVLLGGAELLEGLRFDIVLANINRNILLNDMQSYANTLPAGGELYMSGFYTEDVPVIETKARELGFELLYSKQKNNWAVVRMLKKY
ncbi:MAG: ribosomal protein L11P-lysine N-methyltransferase [Bacteroidetes bacterium]|nr:ribosomal protein L11P-lysine N-methyltransferase [Bacteroidota bacterium]